jgi:hypothetical protein
MMAYGRASVAAHEVRCSWIRCPALERLLKGLKPTVSKAQYENGLIREYAIP